MVNPPAGALSGPLRKSNFLSVNPPGWRPFWPPSQKQFPISNCKEQGCRGNPHRVSENAGEL